MDFKQHFIDRARSNVQRIVLPEGEDERMVQAAATLKKENIVVPVLIGNPENIRGKAAALDLDLSNVEIINPADSEQLDAYSDLVYQARKHKGISPEDARKLVQQPLYYGAAMVKNGDADGSVAGAVHTTADTVRAALQIIGLKPGFNVVSSFFLMLVPGVDYGHKGSFIYADCAVVPYPDAAQLAEIALCAAENTKIFLETEPVVAMLSFSTRGSARHEAVDKVVEATEIIRKRNPQLRVDGEVQFDTAIIPAISEKKSKGNNILKGQANTMVFPNLDAGNICYKATQRLTGGDALGPVLQGLAMPANDLSRGCSAEDIVLTCALTALQAQHEKA